jgi:TP901 family phage tail tape measure protein
MATGAGLEFDVEAFGKLNDALYEFSQLQGDLKSKLTNTADGIRALLKVFDNKSLEIAAMKAFGMEILSFSLTIKNLPSMAGVNKKFEIMGGSVNTFVKQMLSAGADSNKTSQALTSITGSMYAFINLIEKFSGLTTAQNAIEGGVRAVNTFKEFVTAFNRINFPTADRVAKVVAFDKEVLTPIYTMVSAIQRMKKKIDEVGKSEDFEISLKKFTDVIISISNKVEFIIGNVTTAAKDDGTKPLNNILKMIDRTLKVVKAYADSHALYGVKIKQLLADKYIYDLRQVLIQSTLFAAAAARIVIDKNTTKNLNYLVRLFKTVDKITSALENTNFGGDKAIFKSFAAVFDDIEVVFIKIGNIKIQNVNQIEFVLDKFGVVLKFFKNTIEVIESVEKLNIQNASKQLNSFLVESLYMLESMSKLFKKLDGFKSFSFNIFKKNEGGVSIQQVEKVRGFTEGMLGIIKAFRSLSVDSRDLSTENIVENLNKIRRMLSATGLFNIGGFKGIVKSISGFKSDDIKKFSSFAEAVVNIGKVFRVLARIDEGVSVETVIKSLGTIRRMLNGIPLLPFGGFKAIMKDIGSVNKNTVDKFRSFSESILAIAKTLEKLSGVNMKDINFKGFANSVKQLSKGMKAGGFDKRAGFNLGKDFGNEVNRGAKFSWGIRSPSAVFKRFGENIVEGLKSGFSKIKAVVEFLAKTVINAFKGVVNTTKSIFSNIANIITFPFRKAGDAIGGIFKQISNRLRFAINDLRMFVGGLGSVFAGTAIEFEKGLAQVFKTIEIPEETKKEVQATLTQQFRDMATGNDSVLSGLSDASKTILEIAEVAGTLGIPIELMEKFTQTVGAMTIATNLGGEEAATFLGQFSAITGSKDFDKVASTMVTLGNQFAATESGIAEMSNRIAGVGVSFGLSVPEILSFSAAMESVGLNPEAAGTAFSQFMQKSINALAKGGTELELFAKAAGMTGAELKELQKQKPAEFLLDMLEGFSKYPLEEQVVLFDQLGLDGIRVSDMLRRLGNANELVNKAVEVGNDGWRENNALMNEARIRNETTDASIQRLKNRMYDLKITIGNIFAPLVKFLADAIGNAIQRVNVFLSGFVESIRLIRTPIDELKALIDNTFGSGPTGGAAGESGPRKTNPELDRLKTLYDPALGMYQELVLAQGDSLWGIAQRYGVSVDQLREWNGLTKDSVYHYGDTIKIWSKYNSEGEDVSDMLQDQYEEMKRLEDQMTDSEKTTKRFAGAAKVFGKNLTVDQITDLRNDLRGLNKDFADSRKAIGLLFSGETKQGSDELAIAVGNLKENFKSVLTTLGIEITENPFTRRISELIDDIKNKDWKEAFRTALLVPVGALQTLLSSGLNQFGFGEREINLGTPEEEYAFAQSGGLTDNQFGMPTKTITRSLFGFNEELEKRIKEIGKPENMSESIDLAILNIRRVLTDIANGDYTEAKTFLETNVDNFVRSGITAGLALVFGFPFGAIAFVSNMLAMAIENDVFNLRTELEKTEIGNEIVKAVGYIGEQINLALAAVGEIMNPDKNAANGLKAGVGIMENDSIMPSSAKSGSNPFVSYFNALIEDVKDIIDEINRIDFTSITTFVSGILKFINDIVAGAALLVGSVALLELKTFILPLIENIGKTFNVLTEEFTSDDINSLLKIGAVFIAFMNRIKVASMVMTVARFAGLQLLIGGIAEALPSLLTATSGAFGVIEGLIEGDKDKVQANADKALEGIWDALQAFFGSIANSTFNVMEAIGLGPASVFRIQAENSLRGIIAIIDTIITRIKIAALDLQIFNELDPNKERPFQLERDKLIGGLAFGEQFKFSTLELDSTFGFTNSFGKLVATSFRDALSNPENYTLSAEAKERLRYAAINTLLTSGDADSANDAFNVFRMLGIDPETQFTTEQLANLPFLKNMPTNLKEALLRNVALGELGLDQENISGFLTIEGVTGLIDSFIKGAVAQDTGLSETTKADLQTRVVDDLATLNESDALVNQLMATEEFAGFNMLSILASGNLRPLEQSEINGVVAELQSSMGPIYDLLGPQAGADLYTSIINGLLHNQEDAISDEDAKSIARGFISSLYDPENQYTRALSNDYLNGILEGLELGLITSENTTRLQNVGKGIGQYLDEGTKNALGIKSPSTVYETVGENIIEGLQKGIDDNVSDLKKSVDKVVGELETISVMTAIMANKVTIALSQIILNLVVFSSTFTIATTILKLNLIVARSELDLFIDKIEDAILSLARMKVAFLNSNVGLGPGEGIQPTDGTSFYGGGVRAGGKYEVLENGLPFETYRTSKGKTYLISNENGQIYSPAGRTREINAAAGVGMSSMNINEGDTYITVNGAGSPEAVAEAVVKKMEKRKARETFRTLKLSGASGV